MSRLTPAPDVSAPETSAPIRRVRFEREVGEVLTVVDSHLFVLGPGRCFDLNDRQMVGWDPTSST